VFIIQAVRESLSVETMAGKTTSSYLELREKLERTNRNKSAAIEDVNGKLVSLFSPWMWIIS